MYSIIPFLLLASSLSSAALLKPRNVTSTYACNNSPDLCSRSYSDIAQLGAHDSPFVSDSSSTSTTSNFISSANQNVNSTRQLTAGVRLLTAQVHSNNGTWHLCHTSCGLLDAGTLSSWLAEIKSWMDKNPHDVVTILLVNSDNASAEELDAEFKAADIASYGYQPPSTTTALASWPTLQEMIANNSRLVTFVASLTSNTVAPYLLDEFTFVFENNYNVTSLNNFSCDADRPATVQGQTSQAVSSGRLPLVNHFLYSDSIGFGIEAPDTGNITTTNSAGTETGSLGSAATSCTTAYGRKPAFFLVDFFDQGQTLQVVDSVNGITATGRGDVPVAQMTSAGSSKSRSTWLALAMMGTAALFLAA
ncbi:MAG: hypothetical protein OHK93_008380 [Ramalina farinacea]|uniref:PLC-like phosphodiesterase n=1 Tax=Ramalina farinacea TaxID=258253 RepID=A0AA43QMB6_9LECA|nr:hypothetical protein [Ramalina farinacea]